jgi:hypothetical protein
MTFGMRALRTVIAGCAVYYTLVGALLYSAPAFFFARVGHIGAYNAHYERDAGSFIFPYGLLLFFVARDPAKYSAIAAIAGLASALHAGSHFMNGAATPVEVIELVFFVAIAIVLFLPMIGRSKRRSQRSA